MLRNHKNSKIRMTQTLLVFTFMSFLSAVTHAKRCEALFSNDPFLKQQMTSSMARSAAKSVESLTNTTTGARIENKWTLLRPKIESHINKLNQELQALGVALKARDKVTPGTRNVTHTVYLDKFSLNLKESGLQVAKDFDLSDVTLKVRVRKYGTVKNDVAVALENVEFASFTKDHSFVEFKFPDARFKGAVFKPRVYMADRYVKLFGTREFVNRFAEIKAETLNATENQANKDSAEAMLDFLLQGHEREFSFKPLAINLYERISYAVDFIDQSKGQKPFQIQMTLDKSIAFYVPQLGKTIGAYAPEHSVVEIKTPVEYAQTTLDSDTSSIVGYRNFLKFVQNIKNDHLPEYMEGVGKMGHGHRQYGLESNQ